MKIIIALLLFLASTGALAVEVTIGVTLPTLNCDGDDITGRLTALQIYIDTKTIPAAVDANGVQISCATDASNKDTPPTGLVTVPGDAQSDGTVKMISDGGQTYHMRGMAFVNAAHSNFSGEIVVDVPEVPPQVPILIHVPLAGIFGIISVGPEEPDFRTGLLGAMAIPSLGGK